MTGLHGVPMIALRSLRQHLLSTCVTAFSTALGVGLVIAVFLLGAQSEKAFSGGPVGFDAVLGARGSQLQLVLNTVFHLETSPGNLPWSMYQAVKNDRRVELAVPYAVGDNYRGYRIVGTTTELFSEFELQEGRKLEFLTGRPFLPTAFEAVPASKSAIEISANVVRNGAAAVRSRPFIGFSNPECLSVGAAAGAFVTQLFRRRGTRRSTLRQPSAKAALEVGEAKIAEET